MDQGTKKIFFSTFIVTGLGNRASYDSCSHGAGRRMSRTAAKRDLSEDSLSRAMTGKTWQGHEAKALLDEHPSDHKDVEAVMAAQSDWFAPIIACRRCSTKGNQVRRGAARRLRRSRRNPSPWSRAALVSAPCPKGCEGVGLR